MILVAPTAFKGTIPADRAARSMAEGAARAGAAEVRTLPLSDGGNGLIDALAATGTHAVHRIHVTGPLGQPVKARILERSGAAVVESADANGLHLVPEGRRDPMATTTRGVGELIRGAADTEPRAIIVGIGGSATVDGGIGMAQALGWRLLDAGGTPVPPGGAGLLVLDRIEPHAVPALPPITVLRDVNNPLLGPDGAAAVYGPQKGATPAQVVELERGLERLAEILARDLGRDVRSLPGAGAAGGLGAALAAFLSAELVHGAAWVLDAVGFDAALATADVVVTGEGAFDAQSAMGKVVGEVIRRARSRNVPVLLVAGAVEGDVPEGVRAVTGHGAELGQSDLAALVAGALPKLLRA